MGNLRIRCWECPCRQPQTLLLSVGPPPPATGDSCTPCQVPACGSQHAQAGLSIHFYVHAFATLPHHVTMSCPRTLSDGNGCHPLANPEHASTCDRCVTTLQSPCIVSSTGQSKDRHVPVRQFSAILTSTSAEVAVPQLGGSEPRSELLDSPSTCRGSALHELGREPAQVRNALLLHHSWLSLRGLKDSSFTGSHVCVCSGWLPLPCRAPEP